MKKSVFLAVIAVILLAGCAPRENDGSSSSAESSQSSTAISSSSSSTQSFSSSSSLSSSSVSESSGAAQSSESTQSSSSASVQSSSSSIPAQSSSQSTPAQSSSSTPTQSSSQKPASSSTLVQSSSSKQTETSSSPASTWVDDAGYTHEHISAWADPETDTLHSTPSDVTGWEVDADGFPINQEKWYDEYGGTFYDKDGIGWETTGSKWRRLNQYGKPERSIVHEIRLN